MDMSGSVGSTNWQLETGWVSDMITTGISNQSSVAVVTFNTGASVHWNFTNTQHPRSVITDMVNNLDYTAGGTYMRTAFRTAVTVFNKTGSSDNTNDNLLMLITDGNPFPSSENVCDNNDIKNMLDVAGSSHIYIQ